MGYKPFYLMHGFHSATMVEIILHKSVAISGEKPVEESRDQAEIGQNSMQPIIYYIFLAYNYHHCFKEHFCSEHTFSSQTLPHFVYPT